jgi:hypothetical protein
MLKATHRRSGNEERMGKILNKPPKNGFHINIIQNVKKKERAKKGKNWSRKRNSK